MAETKRRITIEDLYKMQWVGDPQVSPDGKQIVYVVKTVDPHDKTKYLSRIWLVATENGQPRQLTAGPKTDSSPRWSPDGGQLAFTTNRADGTQIFLLPLVGGEAKQLTMGKNTAGTPVWSPDGKKIAFISKVSSEAESCGKPEEKSDVKVIARLHYKQNGEGFLGDRNAQIFVVDVTTGEQKQLTSSDHDCAGVNWSPCSSFLAFSSNRTPDSDYNRQSQIWVMPAAGGELRQVTSGEGPCSNPSWSPDGSQIAYLSHNHEYGTATLNRIYLIPAMGGEARVLTADFDREPGNACGSDMVSSSDPGLVWAADGSHITFLATDGPRTKIYSVTTCCCPKVTQVSPDVDQVIYGMTHRGGTYALTVTDPQLIGDIHVLQDGALCRLTNHNQALQG